MNKISLYRLLPTIKEVVDLDKEATFTPMGTSMKPMLLGGRDEIVLVKPVFPLKKYALPLYVRKSGRIVLHRVVKVNTAEGKTTYTMRGDNTFENEKGIEESQITAVVSRFKRKGKWHSTDEKGYLLYCKIWDIIFPVRKGVRFLIKLPVRTYRKIIRIFKL